jgi:hypothetical protein
MLALFNTIPHLGQTTVYRNVMSSVNKKACRSYRKNASSDKTLQVTYTVTTGGGGGDDCGDDDDCSGNGDDNNDE